MKMKSFAAFGFVIVLALTSILSWALLTTRAATGTVYGSSNASILSFSSPCKSAIFLNNRSGTSGVIYIKLNDSGTSATALCSATVYDIALDQNELVVVDGSAIKLFPISQVGTFTTLTTPVLRVTGM